MNFFDVEIFHVCTAISYGHIFTQDAQGRPGPRIENVIKQKCSCEMIELC